MDILKILFLTNLPSPYRVDFFNELGKIADLTVLYERRKATNRDEKWTGSDAYTYKEIYLKGKAIGEESSISLEVFSYLKDKSYTHIVISGYGTTTAKLAILYLRIKHIPFIMNVDGGLIREDHGFKYMLKHFFVSSAKAYFSTSQVTTDYLIHYGAPKEKCFHYPFTSLVSSDIIQCPISDDEKEKLKTEIGLKKSKIVIAVGQFIPRKGFDILLNAIPFIEEECYVYIIGGKVTKEYMSIICENKTNNVMFIDFLSKETLCKYYLAADLFVLPTREDIWGLVVNEAMAKGLPIITTTNCVAGIELVKDGENGYLIPVNDPQLLASKINVVLKDDALRKSMSYKALDVIRSYTIEKMALRCFDILMHL